MEESNKQLDAQRTSQIAEVTTKLDHIRDFGASKDDFAQLYSDLVHIITTGRSVAIEQKVLQSLIFPQMRFRHERIHENHSRTFDWIFESEPDTGDQAHQRPKVHFMEWLRSSESAHSIYWLGGKAGSGKSTLMKYICSHERVQTELQTWSGDDSLVVASFFFWRSGTELQKSQEGLLRSLLFEVLRKCPSIISKVIEIKWTYAIRDPWSRPKEQEPWTQSEMMQVFNLLEDEHIESKFCFFIDGLDEYNGEPSDLIEVVQKLARSSNIKLCISSRPWTDFTRAFDVQGLALHLHELTRNDIRIYVHDKLERHDRFIQEGSQNSAYQELVMEIVNRAQGVFFWVSLVVKSLLKGLTHADSIQILQQRLRALPTDLEELFSHMISSVDPIYESQMGRTFLVAMAASEPLPLILYHTLDELQTTPNVALRMNVCSGKDGRARGIELSKAARLLEFKKEIDMRVRLEARSRGLLEVPIKPLQSTESGLLKVEFLHRTVRDYLEKPNIVEDLFRRANKAEKPGGEFIPEAALCHCLLAGIKMRVITPTELLESVESLLWYASRAEKSTQAAQKDVLDDLERTLSIKIPRENSLSHISGFPYSPEPQQLKLLEKYSSSLIELCVQRGLSEYVRLKVSPELVARRFEKPLLFQALLPTKSPKYELVNTYGSVPFLLENGADPNAAVDSSGSVWSTFLETFFKGAPIWNGRRNWKLPPVEVVDQLLRAGADPNVKLRISIGPVEKSISAFGLIVNQYFGDAQWGQRLHLLRSFVRHGASPNMKYKNATIWQNRLEHLYRTRIGTSSSRYFEEVKLLLQAKADVNVRASKEWRTCTNSKAWEACLTNNQTVEEAFEAMLSVNPKTAAEDKRIFHEAWKTYPANYQTVEEAIKAIFDPHQAAELLQIADEMRDRGMLARLKRSFHGIVQRTT